MNQNLFRFDLHVVFHGWRFLYLNRIPLNKG